MTEESTPVTPMDLASSLLFISESAIKGIKDTARKFDRPLPKADDLWAAKAEIVSAYYCLAVVVLGEQEVASENTVWNLWTAAVFQQLKDNLAESHPPWLLDRVMDEAMSLYLHDKPPLEQYANQLPDFSLEKLVQQAVATQSWLPEFMAKAAIRILHRLNVSNTDLLYLGLHYSLASGFLTWVELFRRMSPIFEEEE